MIRISASLVAMGVLWSGCRANDDKPRDALVPPRDTPLVGFSVPQAAPILSTQDLAKPEGMSALSADEAEAHIARLMKRIRGEENAQVAAEAACFFKGITWQGDDHAMRAEGTADSEGCVTKNENGQDIVYHGTKAAVSIVLACEDGGLTQFIQPGSQLTDMNAATPSCKGKRGAVFYQSKITGDVDMPLEEGVRKVAFTWIGARGQDERTPCLSNRTDGRVTIDDGCQDVASFKATYDDQSSGYYHRFQFHRVAGDAASAMFDTGHLAAQVNDWDGEVSFTTEGTYSHLKRGDEERTTRLP